MPRSTLPRPYRILAVIVYISAAAIGAFFGGIYGAAGTGTVSVIAGILIAGIGGVLAGILWSHCMLRGIRKGAVGGRLVGKGVIWGIIAGAADTLLLQVVGAPLTSMPSDVWPAVLIGGLVLGVAAGGVNGLICGLAWHAVAMTCPLSTAPQE